MRIDIIEVENKKFKIKIVVIFIITLLLIALFSMLGIYCAQKYQENYIRNNKKQNNNIQSAENIEKQENKGEDKTNPQESIEEAKNNKSDNF